MNSSFDVQSYFSRTNKSGDTSYQTDYNFSIEVIYPGQESFVKASITIKDVRIYITNESYRKVLCIIDSILYYLVEREECMIISIKSNEKYYILKFIDKKQFETIFPRIFTLIKKRNFNKYYEINLKLGEGSYSKVYSCKSLDAVSKEIRILKELDHPSVVKLEDVYDGHTHLYLIMEILNGGDLHSRKKTMLKISIKIITYIILQVIEGLEYIHSKGYMHRDLKPSNIVFKEKDGYLIKIIDFGFVEYLDCLQFSIKKCGTPGYLAPEIFIQELYDEKVDIFSLGIILVTFVCKVAFNKAGNNPFRGEDYKATISNNKSGNYDFIEKYKENEARNKYKFILVYSFLRAALNQNPMNRKSATELMEEEFIQLFLNTCESEDKEIENTDFIMKLDKRMSKNNSLYGFVSSDFNKKSMTSLNSLYNSHDALSKKSLKSTDRIKNASINRISSKLGIIENSQSLRSLTEFPFSKSFFKSENAVEYNSNLSFV